MAEGGERYSQKVKDENAIPRSPNPRKNTEINSIDVLIEDAEEQVGKLREQIAALKLHDPKTPKENRAGAKEVFGLLMRAGFRREKNEHAKFQPCKDDLDFLKVKDPALCRSLRTGSLKDFCRILHPAEPHGFCDTALGFDDDDDTVRKRLEYNDSIFHLHGNNSVKADYQVFQDQTERAKALAQEIKEILPVWRNREPPSPVRVRLLDGHGRMLVCLIKAVMDLGLDPDEVLHVTVFEIDEEVHEYHRYVFPRCVEKRKETVVDIRNLDPFMDAKTVIYLNFCSVPSGGDFDAWVSHFENQNIRNWVPHFCKENVLRYIWKAIHPPYCCTVMISLIIKPKTRSRKTQAEATATCESKCKDPPCRYRTFFRKENYAVTGFGFLYLLRRTDLFNADFVSLRPETAILWQQEAGEGDAWREPLSMDAQIESAFATLLVRPKRSLEDFGGLKQEFDKWEIGDLQEDKMQAGAVVEIVGGKHTGTIACIKKRKGVAQLDMFGGYHVCLSSCKPV